MHGLGVVRYSVLGLPSRMAGVEVDTHWGGPEALHVEIACRGFPGRNADADISAR